MAARPPPTPEQPLTLTSITPLGPAQGTHLEMALERGLLIHARSIYIHPSLPSLTCIYSGYWCSHSHQEPLAWGSITNTSQDEAAHTLLSNSIRDSCWGCHWWQQKGGTTIHPAWTRHPPCLNVSVSLATWVPAPSDAAEWSCTAKAMLNPQQDYSSSLLPLPSCHFHLNFITKT